MKKFFSLLAAALLCCTSVVQAANFNELIPRPAQATQGTGTLTLPQGFTVAAPAAFAAEANDFITAINATTGLNAKTGTGSAFITVTTDATLPAEGYKLDITGSGINIAAATPAGAFYAFQTIKKLLPANVMAGVKETGSYAIPQGTIADEPRFEYRGFMLDVSRHFFDADQVKKMLDLMAVYKLNRFHWHLTDDQGWRLPVDGYPKLTVEGATNKNILLTDFGATPQTQTRAGENVIYGPYAYTKEEIKEIVEYAKARHIEVIPEIDMPGHMVAAIHAYPEFSTDPENKNNVHVDLNHEIWNKGGVSRDVLDVSNPKVIQFVKDVVDALVEYFPYNYIHIGGDECPTLAWEKSDACQAFMAEKGLSTERQLQSWFTNEIAKYAASKGRKIMGWNEIITESGVDMDMIKEIDPTIFCWIGGEAKSEQYGLKHVYTPFNGGYYINRSYKGFDTVGAVGDGALSVTIGVNPPANSNCIGVQGTFWTEQVDRYTDLEYLALPRLIGIAEQGWSAEVDKDLDDFIQRVILDEEYLQKAGYNYGKHQLVIPERRKPVADAWYNITTTCTDERAGRALEVSNSQGNKLWGTALNPESERQQFKFVEDPANAGHYAIVCRALPEGSVSSTPSGIGLGDRWSYNESGLDYGFILDKGYYAEVGTDGFIYAIRPANLSGYWLNFARSGQSYAINVYTNPNDGKGGLMSFALAEGQENPNKPVVETEFTPGKYYRLLTRFNGDTSQARYGTCIELMQDASKGNNCQADRLWSNAPVDASAANYDYQWFKFEADPAGSEYFAMVCRAKPEGSVNCMPSVSTSSNTARWDYDNTTKHYGFYLVEEYQGVDPTDGFYSAITSKDATSGWYMNTSAAGQGFSIHLWADPTDQNAGLYIFQPDPDASIAEVTTSGSNAPVLYFDLQGRRVAAPTHGLYITSDGHKVIL